MDQIKEMIARLEKVEELKETHISRVYLTKSYAFKFKKAVQFGFVNFSRLSDRVEACCAELSLNRRLTSGLYLGCLLFKEYNHKLDWANISIIDPAICNRDANFNEIGVVMRRLPEASSLYSLIINGEVRAEDHIYPLASLLASFHKKHSLQPNPEKLIEDFKRQMFENFDILRDFKSKDPQYVKLIALMLSRISSCSSALINLHAQNLKLRAKAGKVVDGHGDLRAEHVYFEVCADGKSNIQIIDCLEFSAELRQVDAASEIAFLSMDLDYLNRADLARVFAEEYSLTAQDQDFSGVLLLFKIYRALVRAKIHALRAPQISSDGELAEQQQRVLAYLGLANRYALNLQGPLVILISGLMGSGKSTIARKLSQMLHGSWISSDYIRKQIYSDCAKGKQTQFGEGMYSGEARERVYVQMCLNAQFALSRNQIVLLDATFARRQDRARVYELSDKSKAPCIVVECRLPRELALERLEKRTAFGSSDSDGRPQLYDDQARCWEEILPEESPLYFSFDSAGDENSEVERLLGFIENKSAKFEGSG